MIRKSFFISIIFLAMSAAFGQQADEIIGKSHLPNELEI